MTAAAKSIGWTKNNFSYIVKDGSLPHDGFFYRYEGSEDISPDGIRDANELFVKRDRANRNVRSAKPVKKIINGSELVYESVKAAARDHPEIKYATLWAAIKHGRVLNGAAWHYYQIH
jgi:hypothetical protein